MKITTFDPLIYTSRSEEIIKLFEALGFEQHHHNQENENRNSTRMKNEGGFHVDIVQNGELKQDITLIRMNVDNFDEARDILASHGFKEGPRMYDAETSKSMGMISPSGFIIGLIEHKKDHE